MKSKAVVAYVEYLFYIVFLHAVTFLLRPMTWTLFSSQPFGLDTAGALESLSNFVIFTVTAFLIALFFKSRSQTMTLGELLKIFFSKVLPSVLGIRLLTDGVHFLLELADPLYSAVPTLIAEAAGLFLIFYVTKRFVCKGQPTFKGKAGTKLLIGAGVLACICVWYAVSNASIIEELEKMAAKYVELPSLYASTAEHKLQLISIVFSLVTWVTLFSLFGIFNSHAEKKQESYKVAPALPRKLTFNRLGSVANPVPEGKFTTGTVTVLIARIFAVTLLSFVCMFPKVMLLPQGFVSDFIRQSSVSTALYSPDPSINSNLYWTQFGRKTALNSQKTVYSKTKVEILFRNRVILEFDRTSDDRGELHSVSAEGVEMAYRYEYDAVAYFNEGVPFAILMQDINSYEKQNDALIEICKAMIREGHFEAFENTYAYLQKYDPQFVKEFTDVYAADDIAESYLKRNAHIRPEYMRNFARSIG
ncbi:MAG: hypothetical protein IJY56_02235 [Clostridia bacterium]|nr:hypothetical protein [Clostridia bacterium]